jgi:DNA-binding response OmpR family regulator
VGERSQLACADLKIVRARLGETQSAIRAPADDVCVVIEGSDHQGGLRPVELTPIEFKLLDSFIRARGRILSRDQLISAAWGPDTFASARIVGAPVRRHRWHAAAGLA